MAVTRNNDVPDGFAGAVCYADVDFDWFAMVVHLETPTKGGVSFGVNAEWTDSNQPQSGEN